MSDRGGSDIKKEAQGGRINDRNGSEASVVGKVTGKVEVPEEMWDNVSAHVFRYLHFPRYLPHHGRF